MSATGADGGWIDYTNETARFTCRHPRSWGRAEGVLGATAVFVDGDPAWDEGEGFRTNVTVGVEPREEGLGDEELFERHAASPPRYLTDPILLDRDRVEVANVPAQRLLVVYRQGPRTLTLEQWCLAAPARTLYLSAATTTNQFADTQPVVEGIVGSLELHDV